ncbi:jerky protein homolog [Procambarus clarkii]|uniref:jerky protein homolog n=1 Tax=Procambarus clarkii TaxID=6728 RepID=UPI0037444DB0
MTFEKKVEIIKMVESGVPRSVVCAEYGISKSTVFDLLKAKPIIFDYFSRSESDKAIRNRKVVSKAKVESVDNAVWEWYKQRREVTEKPVAGWLLVEKAREFHQAMKITQKCVYSDGWLRSFKTRHGIRFIKVHGERQSADIVGADEYVSKFAEMVQEQNLSPEQIYNADETGLYWRMLPTETMAHSGEDDPSGGYKQNKQRISLLCCANAAGTHKLKLLVIGISKNPRALKSAGCIPVIYKDQPSAWMSLVIFVEWFNKNFVPEVKEHLKSVGLPQNSKVVLLLDNSSTHPRAKKPDECNEEDGEEEEEDEETLKEKCDMEKVQQNIEYILAFMDTSYRSKEYLEPPDTPALHPPSTSKLAILRLPAPDWLVYRQQHLHSCPLPESTSGPAHAVLLRISLCS